MRTSEPNEDQVRQAAEVLGRFIHAWELPLNPENLELMAYCVLKYGQRADLEWEAVRDEVDREIRHDGEAHERLLEEMEGSCER